MISNVSGLGFGRKEYPIRLQRGDLIAPEPPESDTLYGSRVIGEQILGNNTDVGYVDTVKVTRKFYALKEHDPRYGKQVEIL